MLRTIFVFAILIIGWGFAFTSELYAAALYLWLAYFRPESWAWSGVFASLNLSYIAGVFLVGRTLVSGVRMRVTWRSGLLLAFLMLSLLSTFAGLYVEHSFEAWQAFAKTIIVSYLLTVIIRTESDLRFILFVIALSLGFEAAKQGWAQLVLNPGGRNDNPIPFLGDNNVVAVGMAMLVPLLSALAATSSGLQKRGLQFVNIGIVYRGLSTYSRGGFLSMGAIAGLSFLRSERKLRALVAGAIVALLVLPALPTEFWDRMSTISAPADERDDSSTGRLHFWQVAVVMANDHPFLGVVHSAYQPSYDQYDWTGGRYRTGRSVHSVWFGVLAESGYTGFALYMLIVLSSLWGCHRVRRMAKHGKVPESLGRYATAIESALIAFMVGGSFVPYQYGEMVWHLFALSIVVEQLAVTAAESARDSRELEDRPVLKEPAEEFVWAS